MQLKVPFPVYCVILLYNISCNSRLFLSVARQNGFALRYGSGRCGFHSKSPRSSRSQKEHQRFGGFVTQFLVMSSFFFLAFLLFWLTKLPEYYFVAQAFANLHGKRRQGKFIWKTSIYMLQTCKYDTAKLILQKVLIF